MQRMDSLVKANQMLRHLMKKQGREIQWFTDITGTSAARMSRIVNGKQAVDPITASVIAGALGVPLLFVFDASSGDDLVPSDASVKVGAA